jgi:hypothetical protein
VVTVVATIDTCYNGNTTLSTCATTSSISPNPPNRVTVFTELPNSSGRVSKNDTFYDTASRVTRVDSYDFGAAAPGALMQSLTTTYGTWNGTACAAIGNNITGRICQSNVLNGAGTTVGQVLNSYDSKGNLLVRKTLGL